MKVGYFDFCLFFFFGSSLGSVGLYRLFINPKAVNFEKI